MAKEYKTTFDQLLNDLLTGKSFYDLIDWKRFVQKETTALIVVDTQNENLHKDGNMNVLGAWKIAEELGLVQNIKNIVAAGRKKAMPVIWVRQAYLAEGKDLFQGTYFEALLSYLRTAVPDMMLDAEWNSEIIDEIKAIIEPKDVVILKHTLSAFEGTNLQTYLTYMGIKTIIVCGCILDQCVESTIRSAWDRGYLSVLVKDATATGSMEAANMAYQRMGLMMAPVIPANEVVSLISSL